MHQAGQDDARVSTTIASYDKVAGTYAAAFSEDESDLPYVERFAALLPESGSLLDAGCGPGNYVRYFASRGFAVTGIDLSAGMLALASRMAPGSTLLQADIRRLPFPRATFDGIFAAYSLIHVPTDELDTTLEGFRAALKPGGLLFLAMQGGENKAVRDESLGADTPLFHACYTIPEITDILEKASFAVLDAQSRKPNANEIPHDKVFVIAKKLASDA